MTEQFKTQTIELAFYKDEYREALENYYLTEEQLQFTASPTLALEMCMSDKDRHPIVILTANHPSGFFVLHTGENISPFTTNPRAILLRAFSINHEHQGKGYAKQVLRMLPEFVQEQYREADEIVLAVNDTNSLARRLYEKSGFIDKGNRRQLDMGEQIILHYSLV
ncbi:GNAT family N-acetyltransferase [Paenibacillus sedimenti]|uniref:GNAT family N-acetyltransferase n=1 Tax=Paenibacillus sedimenti TaxID=2770274 RepID=A0A926KUF5_9BACL|nr:GNAT family N-acetyltransferase [Paenibacillus sedimenti]MBD0383061.1 GNAT family N-acetyltransferase [Paenibacillus sedimenti]